MRAAAGSSVGLGGVIAAVIIGGIRSIARVAAVLVPIMGLIYVVAALVVIGLSAEHIPGALALVMSDAFTGQAASGGILGAMVIGFQRALFSNEAGIGSASIAHSAVKTEAPASEGITALLEPLIDTVIICSLSSLVILTTAIPQGLWVASCGYRAHLCCLCLAFQLGALRDCGGGVAIRVFKRAGVVVLRFEGLELSRGEGRLRAIFSR